MRISTEMLKPQGLCTGSHCLECFSQISPWDTRRPPPNCPVENCSSSRFSCPTCLRSLLDFLHSICYLLKCYGILPAGLVI